MGVPKMKTRAQSPHRDTVSPVPSYYSEPAYLQHRKDVTRDLPSLPAGRRRLPSEEEEEEEEGDEETLSLRSMPSSLPPTVRRSRGNPKRHPAVLPELRLPPVMQTSLHDYREHLEVRGTGYTRCSRFPPILKSNGPRRPRYHDRPPGRAGHRPEQQVNVPCGAPEKERDGLKREEHLSAPRASTTSKVLSDPPPSKAQRITFHNPVVQEVYPITPDNLTQTRKPVEDGQPLYLRGLKPCLPTDNPPPRSSVWTDPKTSAQGRAEWTEPRAPIHVGRGMLLIRLGITLTKTDSSSARQAGPQYYPIHPLNPSLRRLSIPNARRPRVWGRRGTTLGSLLEEEGCLSPPVPVQRQPGLLEPFTGFTEHLRHQLAPAPCLSYTTQLQEEAFGGVQDLRGHTVQTSCSPLPSGPVGPGGLLPKITMTRPTPSPKLPRLLSPTENRHAA